jgi:hypothetical protein
MKQYEKSITPIVLFCLMILLKSCSTSILVDKWSDPSYHEAPLKKILIIAIRRNPVQRRIWEDAFVGELSRHGVDATSSYHFFPNALPDTNKVAATILENGFDGVLVTRILYNETETHYVDAYVTSSLELQYNQFTKRYRNYYVDVQHPAHVDSLVIDRRAIEVWTTKNEGQIIWGDTSNTSEENSVKDVQNDIAGLVITELVQNAIINPGK